MSEFSLSQIPFSILTVSQMLQVHNELAKARGIPPIKTWKDSRVRLVEKVALLRTQKTVACKQEEIKKRSRPQPKRDAIMRQLAKIDYYEEVETGRRISSVTARKRPPGSVVSVGLPYKQIMKNLDATFGESMLWVTAAKMRQGAAGHTKYKLPQKRARR